ncbi:indole-3-glycerol phosphate synthase TrpC [Anoxybacterium hadale]|uniref:Indole-3-glycerol phosphate synthase TrpC n=1 Tax=Anoxybacterium hadale TaxID=3408580 RepID=A0ACD1A9Q0_9FIRM|nr:indole-3-glycerol phosphate synthase TrpC [Clostridiales bacterium]
MKDILSVIAERTRERVIEQKQIKSYSEVIRQAEAMCTGAEVRLAQAMEATCDQEPLFPFQEALSREEMSFICEVKKASPSKGVLDETFPYVKIAAEYEAAGAAAISVLTEPYWFLGSGQYLKEIREIVKLPILRKDFTVDPYQIYESKLLGADAILLICALMEEPFLKECLQIAKQLGLSALVEAHTETEAEMAVNAGAEIIGVNNRNLKTFEVDLETSIRLRKLVPDSILFVSESGIKTAAEIKRLKSHSVNGVLIGETLMRSSDKKRMLSELRGESGEE